MESIGWGKNPDSWDVIPITPKDAIVHLDITLSA